MILVSMRDHQADQLVPAFGDEAGIGHHDFDFGVLVTAEADAAIDGEIFTAAAVEVEVHADLARPAQGQEG
jgi:hypothetical protein